MGKKDNSGKHTLTIRLPLALFHEMESFIEKDGEKKNRTISLNECATEAISSYVRTSRVGAVAKVAPPKKLRRRIRRVAKRGARAA